MTKKKNMSITDRTIRIVVAVVFSALVLTQVIGSWSIVLISFAAVLIVTSIIGNCPLYTVFGVNTCRRNVQP